eukprot:jgi/Bigna1/68020/fgenesh1_pg.5_\
MDGGGGADKILGSGGGTERFVPPPRDGGGGGGAAMDREESNPEDLANTSEGLSGLSEARKVLSDDGKKKNHVKNQKDSFAPTQEDEHDDDEDEPIPDLSSEENKEKLKKLIATVPEDVANRDLAKFICEATLRFRKGHFLSAKERVKNYFEWREKYLGGYEVQNLNENPEVLAVLKSGLIRLAPVVDEKNRAALIVQLKRHTPTKTSALTVLRTWHYVVMRALRKASVQHSGIVMLTLRLDLGGAGFSNLDLRIPKTILDAAIAYNVKQQQQQQHYYQQQKYQVGIAQPRRIFKSAGAISKNVPLRVHRICVIRPFMILRVLLPIFKPFMSQKIRSRLVVLPDPSSKEQGLAQHLDVGKLPEDICGTKKEFNHLATVESWEKEDSKSSAASGSSKEEKEATTHNRHKPVLPSDM